MTLIYKVAGAVIDRRYALIDVPAASEYLEEGHARRKIGINVDSYGAGF